MALDQYDIPLLCADGSLEIIELKGPEAGIVARHRNHLIVTDDVHRAVSRCLDYLRSLDEVGPALTTQFKNELGIDFDLRRAGGTVVIGHPGRGSKSGANRSPIDQTIRSPAAVDDGRAMRRRRWRRRSPARSSTTRPARFRREIRQQCCARRQSAPRAATSWKLGGTRCPLRTGPVSLVVTHPPGALATDRALGWTRSADKDVGKRPIRLSGVLMSYIPPPEPQAHPTPAHQPWTDPHGRGWPGGPPPVEPPKGAGVAAVALVLGVIACVVWLLPINLDTIRAYSPLPFALLGFVLAIVALAGHRRGKPMAAIGAILSCLAMTLSLIMVMNRS